jgi:hypothetical protein
LLLAGCASTPEPAVVYVPQEVKVPVKTYCAPDAALLEPLKAAPPVFIASCPPATSGLDQDGEKRLMAMLWELKQRVRAWEAHDVGCRGD